MSKKFEFDYADTQDLTPAEWLEEKNEYKGESIEIVMAAYATYVAKRVARNVRHMASEIAEEEASNHGVEAASIGIAASNRIMAIQFRDCLPDFVNNTP